MKLRYALTAIVLCSSFSVPALAQRAGLWPQFRHDPQRTGRVEGTGSLTDLSVAWRTPIGGTLDVNQSFVVDIDDNGQREVVLASGGAVLVRSANDTIVARTPLFGAIHIYGVWNLDNEGAQEIVALGASPRGIYVFNASTGEELWRHATNDASPGVTVIPAPNNTYDLVERDYDGESAITRYSMATIARRMVTPMWTRRVPGYDIQRHVISTDLNNDDAADLIVPTARGFIVLDQQTGTERTSIDLIGMQSPTPCYQWFFITRNVDGMPGDEIIAVDGSYYYSEDAGIYVLKYNTVPAPSLTVLWSQYIRNDTTMGPGNDVGRRFIRMFGDGVTDLDGDGSMELAYSEWNTAMSEWKTVVRDAQSGAVLGERVGFSLEGTAAIDRAPGVELVLRDATLADPIAASPAPLFGTLRGYNFSRAAPMATRFTDKMWRRGLGLERAGVVRMPGYSLIRNRFSLGGYHPLALGYAAAQDIGGATDPSPDLYIYYQAPEESARRVERPTHIDVIDGSDGALLREWLIPAGAFATVNTLAPNISGPMAPAQALVAVNDGTARVLSNQLTTVGNITEGNYARLPSVVSFDDRTSQIMTLNSLGYLQGLSGTDATNGTPNRVFQSNREVIQSYSRGYISQVGVMMRDAPGATDAAPPGPAILVIAHTELNWQNQSLLALDASGRLVWETPLGDGRRAAGFDNPVVADFTGDSRSDLFMLELNSLSTEQLVLRDGAMRGAIRHSLAVGPALSVAPEMVTAGAYFQGYAAADLNGDRVPEIVGALHPSWFAGLTLNAMAIAPRFVANGAGAPLVNGQAIVAPFGADGATKILRVNSQNAYGPYVRFSLMGAIEASVLPSVQAMTRDATDQNNASIVSHLGAMPQRFDFVTTGMSGTETGIVTLYDTSTMMVRVRKHLSRGDVTDVAPAARFALYDPITLDADGDGDDEVIVGSDDGFLYILHGATLAKKSVIDLGSPVVFLIAADLDRDPQLELLASLQDGTLVAIDGRARYQWSNVVPPMGGDGGAEGGLSVDGPSANDSTTDARRLPDASVRPPSEPGCSCRTGTLNTQSRSRSALGLLLALVAVATRVHRRSRRD